MTPEERVRRIAWIRERAAGSPAPKPVMHLAGLCMVDRQILLDEIDRLNAAIGEAAKTLDAEAKVSDHDKIVSALETLENAIVAGRAGKGTL